MYLTLTASPSHTGVDSRLPGVNIISLLLVGIFVGGCLYFIYKPAVRELYRIDRGLIILSVFYGIVLLGISLI